MSARLRAVAPLADRSRSVLCGDVRRSGLIRGSVLGHQGLEEKKKEQSGKRKQKLFLVYASQLKAQCLSITIVSERI